MWRPLWWPLGESYLNFLSRKTLSTMSVNGTMEYCCFLFYSYRFSFTLSIGAGLPFKICSWFRHQWPQMYMLCWTMTYLHLHMHLHISEPLCMCCAEIWPGYILICIYIDLSLSVCAVLKYDSVTSSYTSLQTWSSSSILAHLFDFWPWRGDGDLCNTAPMNMII